MIAAKALTKRFDLDGGGELLAVDAVSFEVGAGEVYALLGPNGAGKTTTIRMILGLLTPTSGEAVIDGYRSSSAPTEVKRRVGLVQAHAGVYANLSVREALGFFADIYGLQPGAAQARIAELADLLGFARLLRRPCGALSTGERQRVNLARALIHDPPVLLLDEPTTGLDILGSQLVVEFVAHVRGLGKAVILCTHRMEEAERLGTRFGILDRGRLAREGTLAELQAATGREALVDIFLHLAEIGPLLQGSRA